MTLSVHTKLWVRHWLLSELESEILFYLSDVVVGNFIVNTCLHLLGHYFTLRVLAVKAMKRTWVFIFSCWKFWEIQILAWKTEMLETNRIFLMSFKLKKRKSWYLFRYVQKSSSLFFSFSSPYFFFWNTKCETTSSLLNTFKFLFNQPLVFQKNSLDQNSTNSVLCAGSGSESRDTAQTSTSTPDFVSTQLYHRAGKQWPRTESQMAVKVISQPKTEAACRSPMQSQRNWVPPT